MYAYKEAYKQKWKHKVVAILYSAFLLAEHGEFFVENKHEIHYPEYQTHSRETAEIPEHLPENVSENTYKVGRVCYRTKQGSSKEKCVNVLLPALN
jgi:hypothetical protein